MNTYEIVGLITAVIFIAWLIGIAIWSLAVKVEPVPGPIRWTVEPRPEYRDYDTL